MKRRLLKLARLLSSRQGRRGLRHGVGMAIEHRHALAHLRPAAVLDIGANKGQFALLARSLFPDAPLFAFEPLARPAWRFRRALANDPKVRLIGVAIGPTETVTTMHLSAQEDSSSLLPIGKRQTELFPATVEAGTTKVRVAPLERLLPPEATPAPTLLKMDVQGFELPALQGCESRLSTVGWIYVECSYVELYEGQALAPEVEAWLAERGFRLAGQYNPTLDADGRLIQADLLFVGPAAA